MRSLLLAAHGNADGSRADHCVGLLRELGKGRPKRCSALPLVPSIAVGRKDSRHHGLGKKLFQKGARKSYVCGTERKVASHRRESEGATCRKS